jgi:glyoxylase-like metal-dependent hydrolase (beta-lactamase superfamily II)
MFVLRDQAGGGLIAGDMVASQGTIIVSPQDEGDMALYLASLRRLLALGHQRIWPAHGIAVEEGEQAGGPLSVNTACCARKKCSEPWPPGPRR